MARRRGRRTPQRHRIVRVPGGRCAYTNTSAIPDAVAVQALRFVAREVSMAGVVVHFKRCGKSRRSSGRAYDGIPLEASLHGLRPREWRYLIVVTDAGDWVDTLAHEGKHTEQYRERLPRSEVRCRAFAAGVARRWQEQAAVA